MRLLTTVLIACAATALAGCAAVTPAPAGPFKVGQAQVTLGRTWSNVSGVLPGRTPKVRVLSIDGPLLNRVYITDGLSPGQPLIKAVAKEKPTPVIRAGMSSAERIEFVTDSIAALNYQRVEASNPRPAQIGAQSAVRFDIDARTPEGLDIKGTALTAEAGGKTYVVLYLAPAEHYFQATLPEVEQLIASLRLSA